MYRAGFVNIIGNPNVGKSTLMNVLVGERISIITSKSQTTRHRIRGIVNGEDYQIVYSDTPGVLKPVSKLQQSMLNFSSSALIDADILLYVTDTVEQINKNEKFLEKVRNVKVPVLLVINKVDLSDMQKLDIQVTQMQQLLPNVEIFPVSALHRFNVDNLLKRIVELLPQSPPYFGEDALTDKPARFFVSEIIREKILLYYQKEIPYSVEVVVESYKETPGNVHIQTSLITERESQKGILIGHEGKALKKVGSMARRDIERFLQKKVFLELFVKVEKNWRDSDAALKSFGYQPE